MRRIENIKPPCLEAKTRAEKRWDDIAKPLHSLGFLEDAIVKLAGVYGSESFDIDKRAAVIMCADNGVVKEGVSQTESYVTSLIAGEIAKGRSAVNCLARVYGAEVLAVDMGMSLPADGVLNMRIGSGTRNITRFPAMSRRDAERAVGYGIDIMERFSEKGIKIVCAGEMGIGNTTTAAAVASALLNLPPEKTVGRGAGIDDAGLERKILAVKRAVSVNKPKMDDPIDILSKLGGFDIAGMTGLFLGGAVYRIPVITDGLISAAAAALAAEISPAAKEFMLASHASREPAAKALIEKLGLTPIIYANSALGEGTGALMLLPLLDGALEIFNSAHRFDELPMERYVKLC